jgi:hypothetical protein
MIFSVLIKHRTTVRPREYQSAMGNSILRVSRDGHRVDSESDDDVYNETEDSTVNDRAPADIDVIAVIP